jgi:hypothetical protein
MNRREAEGIKCVEDLRIFDLWESQLKFRGK